MAVRFNLPIIAFDDANGNPLAGGFIEFYDTQSSNAKDVWEDDDLTIPADNIDPNTVGSTGYVLDSAGRHGDIFLEPGDYKIVVKDANDVIIKTMDPVHGSSSNGLESSFYDQWVNIVTPSDGGAIIFDIVRPLRLPASLLGSIFKISSSTLPTATLTYTLYKNNTSIGTLAYSTLGVVTKTFVSAITFAIGDQFIIIEPALDATAANVSMTYKWDVL